MFSVLPEFGFRPTENARHSSGSSFAGTLCSARRTLCRFQEALRTISSFFFGRFAKHALRARFDLVHPGPHVGDILRGRRRWALCGLDLMRRLPWPLDDLAGPLELP